MMGSGTASAFAATDGLLGLGAAAAVDPPAAAVGDDTDLFHVNVDHMTGPAGTDATRCAVVLTGRVEVPAAVEPEVGQVPADGADRDPHTVACQLEGDAAG